MELKDWFYIGTALITYGGAVAGVTTFFTRSIFKLTEERLSDKLKEAQERLQVIDGRYRELLEAGSLLAQKKLSIDKELALLADRVSATAGSVFIPAPSYSIQAQQRNLVFFSVLGGASHTLNRERIPMEGTDAGKAFTSQGPVLSVPLADTASFSNNTDEAAKFQTRSKLSVPLVTSGKCVGVVQLLNKRLDDTTFSDWDLRTVLDHVDLLASLVAELSTDPENLRRLGITPSEVPLRGTVLFADISNSSKLAQRLDLAQVADMYNQYFEAIGGSAIEIGGAIDQILGDGIMTTFSVVKPLGDHELCAAKAAIEMQRKFVELKSRWTSLGYLRSMTVFNRIGVATGVVKRTELGHPLYKRVTVLGEPVNIASRLCSAGPRDRNVILLDEGVTTKLPPDMCVQKLYNLGDIAGIELVSGGA